MFFLKHLSRILTIIFLCVFFDCGDSKTYTDREGLDSNKVATLAKPQKDSCYWDMEFDGELFEKYYSKDTSDIPKNIIEKYRNWTDDALWSRMLYRRRDGYDILDSERVYVARYGVKRGMPDFLAYLGTRDMNFDKCKRILYTKKSIEMGSCYGYLDYAISYGINNPKKRYSIILEASGKGCPDATNELYKLYKIGLFYSNRFYDSINDEKRDFFFNRALEQKDPDVCYERALQILESRNTLSHTERKEAYGHLIYFAETHLIDKNRESCTHCLAMVEETLNKYFKEEWTNYKIKHKVDF